MTNPTYLDGFIPNSAKHPECTQCGVCLQKCPVMRMKQEEAEAEILRLTNSEETNRVLKECTFCFGCNRYCPNGLKPYNLIMERMAEKNRNAGAPLLPFVTYMINGRHEPGFFNDLYEASSEAEKAIVDQWGTPPATTKDLLYVGCYGRTIPFGIEHAVALAGLPKYGPRDSCCGDIPYRFGDFQAFSEIVAKTFKQLSSLNIERLVCYCASCANYFGNVWPACHGLRLPFEVVSLYEWLWEQYQTGHIRIESRVEQDVVISDSCHVSELGERCFGAVRGLYGAGGRRVVELRNAKDEALCCGFASEIRAAYDETGVRRATERKMSQIVETGCGKVSCTCHGCVAHLRQNVGERDIEFSNAMDDLLAMFGGSR